MTAAMGGVLYEAWDFGDSPALTSWVVGRYVPATDTLYVMDYRSWEHGEASKVAADIGAIGYTTGEKAGMTPAVRVGDIMDGRSNKKTVGGRRQKPIHGWIRNLGREGIRISGQQLEVESAIKTVRDKLIARKIMFMPSACRRHHRRYPSASECVQEYKRFLPKGVTPEEYEGHATPPPSKGIYTSRNTYPLSIAATAAYARATPTASAMWAASTVSASATDGAGRWITTKAL
jgi:hypothetical protein